MTSPAGDSAVIALYGVADDAPAIEVFWTEASRLMARLGPAAVKASVHRPGRTGEPIAFDRASADLRTGGCDDVTDVTLFSLDAEAAIPLRDYAVLCSYSRRDRYALVAARISIAALRSPEWMDVAPRMLALSGAPYGIGYERPQRLGPVPYALGIAQGLGFSGPEREEAEAMSRWGHTGMPQQVYRHGQIRDVYPWNFLSGVHLARLVEGRALGDWIREARGSRGRLNELTADRWLWDVPTESLDEVRAQLRSDGVVFA